MNVKIYFICSAALLYRRSTRDFKVTQNKFRIFNVHFESVVRSDKSDIFHTSCYYSVVEHVAIYKGSYMWQDLLSGKALKWSEGT